MNVTVGRSSPLRGELSVPGDKSITHRAFMLSALASGPSRISGYLDGGDCRATMGCLRALGVNIEEPVAGQAIVAGVGVHGWREPEDVLNCVRSGTTMRLMAGLLAGQPFYSVLSGEAQLRRRPMDRVVQPLRRMGGRIEARNGGRLPPISLLGAQLRGIDYAVPVASAQVKSCVLLAGLYAEGTTCVSEPELSRDHTERMLRGRGVWVTTEGRTHSIVGPATRLEPLDTAVPSDFSSAAFFAVGASLVPQSELLLTKVNINPTRTGLLDVLHEMGADIGLLDAHDEGGEPVADLVVRPRELHGVDVGGDTVPRMIDEFPILALAATQARGTTRVRDAAELRVKETDRIATIVQELRALGARIAPRPDGYEIEGPTPLVGASVHSHDDHRLAMTLIIAGLLARGETHVGGTDCIGDSFPGFEAALERVAPGCLR